MKFLKKNLLISYIASILNMILSLSGSLSAQTTAPIEHNLIPRQLLFGNPAKTAPKLSPDGKLLAYLAPDANGILNIWIAQPQAIESTSEQITFDKRQGIRRFLWQFDNNHLLYIQDKEGDENDHLYQVDVHSKLVKDLTPYEGVKVNILAYTPTHPDEMLINANQRNATLFDVYRLNLQTGQWKIDTENPGQVFHWLADHNMVVRVAQSYSADGHTITHIRNDANDPWRQWWKIAPDESGEVVAFSPENQSLYALTNQGVNTERLLKINLHTDQWEEVAQDANYDLAYAIAHPVTHKIEALGVDRKYPELIFLDKDMADDFKYLQQKLPNTALTLVSRQLNDQQWILAAESDQHPIAYYLYNRIARQLHFLFSQQPDLEQYQLSPILPITFQSRDKMTLHGYLTLPQNAQPQNLPTVLLVHGGPWVRDSWGWQPIVQWLANRGYAVLQINYRGSTGYGKQYMNAGNREWAGKMHDDLLDGKEWLISKGVADPQKVAIFGGSYGGYATLVGLTFTPEAFCCGVDIVGPSNLVTLIQTLPPYWNPLKPTMDLRVGNLETEPEFLKARSPLFKAQEIIKPLLIAQGANDPRVKQSESDQIVAAMREKQLPVEYLLFPDEGHGFAQPVNRLKFYQKAEEFLAKYAGGRQEPIHTPAQEP